MYFVNEIRKVEGYGKITQEIKLRPQEIKLAEQLVKAFPRISTRSNITTHIKRI